MKNNKKNGDVSSWVIVVLGYCDSSVQFTQYSVHRHHHHMCVCGWLSEWDGVA